MTLPPTLIFGSVDGGFFCFFGVSLLDFDGDKVEVGPVLGIEGIDPDGSDVSWERVFCEAMGRANCEKGGMMGWDNCMD